jgi:uncharacterized protein (TIGR00369 family)
MTTPRENEFAAADPGFEARVRASFAKQALMTLLGASLARVEPGAVDLVLPFRAELTQQDGFVHAAATTAIADSSCGYAALSLTPPRSEVLTVEFKVNLLRPAVGDTFLAEGRVLKPGATLTVARADVFARTGTATRTLVATMLATILRREAP